MMNGIGQYKSTDLGAPVLNGIGSLIGVIDAIRNGYGSVAVVSLTRVGNVVTVETSTAHGLATLNVAEISGAVETAYNGQWPVATVPDATHYTYNIGAATPSSPATGTISSKRAGIGWAKTFTGTNKAAYKLPALSPSTGLMLRVDDSAADVAAVLGYETMTDVDNGSGVFPNTGIASWRKNGSGAAVRSWAAYSDGLMLRLFVRWHGTTYPNTHAPYAFGDLMPMSGLDTFHCMLQADNSNNTGGPYLNTDFHSLASGFNSAAANCLHMPRGYGQLGSAVRGSRMSLGGPNQMGSYTMLLPAPHDNGLHLAPLIVLQGGVDRARDPGLYVPLHSSASQLANIATGDRQSGIANLPGRTVEFVRIPGDNAGNDVMVAVDITGPWR